MACAHLSPPQSQKDRPRGTGPYRRSPRTLDYGRVATSQIRASQGPALRSGGIVVALLTSVVVTLVGVAIVWLTVAVWRDSTLMGVSAVMFWVGIALGLWGNKPWRL